MRFIKLTSIFKDFKESKKNQYYTEGVTFINIINQKVISVTGMTGTVDGIEDCEFSRINTEFDYYTVKEPPEVVIKHITGVIKL